jgi:hypothetical protein
MLSPGMLRLVALVRTNVSEECSASVIRVTRISKLGTTLILVTLIMEAFFTILLIQDLAGDNLN